MGKRNQGVGQGEGYDEGKEFLGGGHGKRGLVSGS
jgi:hypothetical protein